MCISRHARMQRETADLPGATFQRTLVTRQRHRALLRGAAVDVCLIGKPAGDDAMHDAQHRADGIR